MQRVAMDEFRIEVDELVRAASSGETVLIVEGDSVVAELVPPRKEVRFGSDLVAVGTREGWLTPAIETGPLPPSTQPPELTLDELLDELARDRADR